jgi:hypothetical protein
MMADRKEAEPSRDRVAGESASRPRLIAVTLRLDERRYERLKLYGVRRRLTNQQILVHALDLLLEST